MKQHLRLFAWVLLVCVLSGCGGMLNSDQPAEHLYWLEAVDLQLGESRPPLPDLIVTMSALPGLDTDQILVKGPGARLNYYAGARWPDYAPEVVAVAVRLSLESSGRFDRVSSRVRTSGAEWELDLELREFFAMVTTTGSPPQIHVELAGHIECGADHATIDAAAIAPAQQDKLSDIVASFQLAIDNAIISLGQQLRGSCLN